MTVVCVALYIRSVQVVAVENRREDVVVDTCASYKICIFFFIGFPAPKMKMIFIIVAINFNRIRIKATRVCKPIACDDIEWCGTGYTHACSSLHTHYSVCARDWLLLAYCVAVWIGEDDGSGGGGGHHDCDQRRRDVGRGGRILRMRAEHACGAHGTPFIHILYIFMNRRVSLFAHNRHVVFKPTANESNRFLPFPPIFLLFLVSFLLLLVTSVPRRLHSQILWPI